MAGGGIGEAALIGAALGGTTSAMQGGDPLQGALLGGVTGGAGAGLLGGAGAAAGAAADAAQFGIGASGATSSPGIMGALGNMSTPAKAALGLGGLGLMGMMGPRPGMPEMEKYSGPLSKFQYDPSTYTPYRYQPYADGGPVADMSYANEVGANTGYPMADIAPRSYANPYQQPIPQNVVSGSQDTRVDPYTGEERLAKGGAAKVDNMAAIDSYMAQAGGGDMASVLAKARSGDYNAMIALNKLNGTPNKNYAGGGLSDLGSYSDGGRLLRGPGDGVSDSIPAMIGQKQPARLADGEFVVPARIVSEIGNGSTEAGARELYKMMDRVQRARGKTTGKGRVAKDTKASKYLPA